MKKLWTLFFVMAMVASAPALAEYPDDCLGPNEPSGSDCMGSTYEGCCDAVGRVIWCDGDQLYCIDCAGVNPECGWSEGGFYDCGSDGSADPSGTNPKDCVQCDPPCGEGEICVGGVCEVCTPDCEGKQCGSDGCGGQCGECAGQCVEGLCHAGPGCEEGEGPGCGGCACEACVCEMDSFCCETAWDGICVGECIADCGGCATIESCGDGTCDGIETCSNCPSDCACAEGTTCFNGACCTPWCGGHNCGDDGCGGSCGECEEGLQCMEGACMAPATGPGCDATEGVAGCGGCECEACVCEMDSYCCDTEWDGICVSECIECGSCIPVTECGNAVCEPGEDCGACEGDCPCAPGFECTEGVCTDTGVCEPQCEGKVCGADGCGGTCGLCDEGFKCEEGACVEDICTPDCEGFNCGDDGCGGSCGECTEPEVCMDGICGVEVISCEGLCGGQATNCFCDELCFENGDCCDDVCDFCGDLEGCVPVCEPQCEGKVCGDDGCEGSCGVCDAGECVEGQCVVAPECGNGTIEEGETCEADADCGDGEICTDCACVAGCVPACDGKECGDDGCGGSCGECGEGLICGEAGLCEEETPVEGDVVADTTGEEPEDKDDEGSDGGCTATTTANGSTLVLLMVAFLAMAAIRRREEA
jgi:hypothetical protein